MRNYAALFMVPAFFDPAIQQRNVETALQTNLEDRYRIFSPWLKSL